MTGAAKRAVRIAKRQRLILVLLFFLGIPAKQLPDFSELAPPTPVGQRGERFSVFGLKGRFCQPRPQAWVNGGNRQRPVRAVRPPTCKAAANRPFRASVPFRDPTQAFGLG